MTRHQFGFQTKIRRHFCKPELCQWQRKASVTGIEAAPDACFVTKVAFYIIGNGDVEEINAQSGAPEVGWLAQV